MLDVLAVVLLVAMLVLWCFVFWRVKKRAIIRFFSPNPYPGAVEEAAEYFNCHRLATDWYGDTTRRQAAYYRAWPYSGGDISYSIGGDGVREP